MIYIILWRYYSLYVQLFNPKPQLILGVYPESISVSYFQLKYDGDVATSFTNDLILNHGALISNESCRFYPLLSFNIPLLMVGKIGSLF